MATLDPQMQEVLAALAALDPKPIEMLDPTEARKQPTPADAVRRVLEERGQSTEPEAVADADDRKINNAGSARPLVGKNPIRVYTPIGDGPFPVLLYFHGGGFVIADLDVYDSSPRALANAMNAIVVSAHYRQGPEDPYPAAHDDAFAAYDWTVEHMEELGGDGRFAIAGESAGGNLALSTTLRAKEAGMPLPLHQLLVYPIADGDLSKPAFTEYADAKPLNTPMMEWFGKHYAPDQKDPYFAVSEADLSGLSPTTIVTAEVDPLRDDGKLLAERLKAANVDVEHGHFMGVTHEFFGMGAAVDKAKEAVEYAATRLTRSFATKHARTQ
ncbi:MAG: alpha/beta hydrolase [Actinomycetota bacterium]|nr:alpha/beta hydrolase [Actinomycetota bacterium]